MIGRPKLCAMWRVGVMHGFGGNAHLKNTIGQKNHLKKIQTNANYFHWREKMLDPDERDHAAVIVTVAVTVILVVALVAALAMAYS